jgi:hypothetical protein
MTKSRWAATGLLALAFALGGLAGGVATMVADKDDPREGGRGSRTEYLAQMRREFIDQLREALRLTPDQERGVIEVLDRHQPAFDSLWRAVRTQFDAERQAVRRDIRGVLTADQQDRYDEFLVKRDSIHRAREARRDQAK